MHREWDLCESLLFCVVEQSLLVEFNLVGLGYLSATSHYDVAYNRCDVTLYSVLLEVIKPDSDMRAGLNRSLRS